MSGFGAVGLFCLCDDDDGNICGEIHRAEHSLLYSNFKKVVLCSFSVLFLMEDGVCR